MIADRSGLNILAARVEGNLLAAAQELEKLHILYGASKITDEMMRRAVADNARYDVLPLYSKLSVAEQERVFKPSGNKPRIVLATNVAETSLTVPGIGCVIDSGHARISRYSHKSKIQRLPIERISQASANQRAGRCGRVAEAFSLCG